MIELLPSTQQFERFIFNWCIYGAFVFVVLHWIAAPYGRHNESLKRGLISARWSWILMEWPAVFVFSAIFFMAPERQVVHWIFYLTWMTHYVYRTLIYPFRLSRSARPFPWIIVFLGFVFQMINAPLCGYHVFWLRQDYGLAWLGDIRLFVGIGLFGLGFWMNQSADQTLINIRKKFPGEYKIPEGGMYRWISCPNYLGEILEWTGWAVMTWSVSGLAFSVWTIANLAPRALSHHKWYKKKFAEYPKSRKALVPGVI